MTTAAAAAADSCSANYCRTRPEYWQQGEAAVAAVEVVQDPTVVSAVAGAAYAGGY